MRRTDRRCHRFVEPLLALPFEERHVVVAQRDAGAGEPLDGLDEVEMLDLADERDRVATLLAAETVAGEDVVLEREGVLLDDRAEHLLDAIRRLDRPYDPAPRGHALSMPANRRRCSEQEEILREVFVDEMNPDRSRSSRPQNPRRLASVIP